MSFTTALDPTDAENIVSSNTADQAWPTIPIEDDPTPPDTAGWTLVSDIADFARPLPGLEQVTDDPASVTLTYGLDLDFDFMIGEPVGLQYGSIAYADPDAQVEQWIAKALMTQAGVYLIYPADYGSILPSLIGATGPDQTIFSEVSRTVTDVMTAHPRVTNAVVDAVVRQPLATEDGLFISARIWLDTSDDPTTLTMLAG
jgi:Protein of unknown function (DUF2634)